MPRKTSSSVPAEPPAPDAILLDLELPDRDGKDVIREARAFSQVPIIVLSARDCEGEKIAALDLGADDYVNKPFGIGEVFARIRAVTRSSNWGKPVQAVFRAGRLTIDTERHAVDRDGVFLKLTPNEFDLLLPLIRNAGRVLTHKQILSAVWGLAHTEDLNIYASSWDNCVTRSNNHRPSHSFSLRSWELAIA